MANRPSALAALSDPTRRLIFERVSERPMAVGEIAAQLPVTRPAVSQHLKVLKDARLVRDVAEGARRVYHVDPAGLGEVRRWLDQHWERTLGRFQDLMQDKGE